MLSRSDYGRDVLEMERTFKPRRPQDRNSTSALSSLSLGSYRDHQLTYAFSSLGFASMVVGRRPCSINSDVWAPWMSTTQWIKQLRCAQGGYSHRFRLICQPLQRMSTLGATINDGGCSALIDVVRARRRIVRYLGGLSPLREMRAQDVCDRLEVPRSRVLA